jgi:hypothetical protein
MPTNWEPTASRFSKRIKLQEQLVSTKQKSDMSIYEHQFMNENGFQPLFFIALFIFCSAT